MEPDRLHPHPGSVSPHLSCEAGIRVSASEGHRRRRLGDGIQNLLRASLHTVPSSATTAAVVPDVGYPEGGLCSGCKSAKSSC